jgi:hypothetical protein
LRCASGVAGVLLFGTRPDLVSLVTRQDFLLTSALALATAGLSAAAALVLAVPGAERSALVRGIPLAVLGMWTLTAFMTVLQASHGLSGVSDWYVCAIRVAAIGLVPGNRAGVDASPRSTPQARMDWRAGSRRRGLRRHARHSIHLPVDDAGHALLGHLGPVLALAAPAARRPRDYWFRPENLRT